MPKKKNFEQALNRLEEIIADIENNETTLEESVKLYKEGVELSVFCGESLQKTEREITLLKQKADGVFEEVPFENAED